MRSSCCDAETIKGGVLNGEQVLICVRCKKSTYLEDRLKAERDFEILKIVNTDLMKKIKKLKEEKSEMRKYITKLEKFIQDEKRSN